VTDVIPIYQESTSETIFAVLYQRFEHSIVTGRPVKKVKREIEKYAYD
jgi:hypothetical protein